MRCRLFITSITSPITPCWCWPANSIRLRPSAGINATFGAIPRPTRKLTPTYTEEPAQDGEREVTLRRTGGQQIEMMAYHIPAAAHPDLAAIEVLVELMGDRTSGRLHKALVETKKAVSASAPMRTCCTIPATCCSPPACQQGRLA